MNRISKRAFLALLLAVLFAVPAGVIQWSHKETTAYYENRTLAERPALTWQSLWDGTFATAFESWFSDHAPGRTTLLEADTAVQMNVLHRPVVNDIVLSADGVLVPFLSYDEYTEQDYAGPAASIAENYGKLNDHVKANGGSFYFVGLPEQRVYFEEKFPDYLNNHETEAQTADALFIQALEDQGVRFLNMEEVYDALGRPEEFYSTVDHHYNYYGAYTAYRSIMDTLASDGWNLPVLTEDGRIAGILTAQDLVELVDDAMGDDYAKLGGLTSEEDLREPAAVSMKKRLPWLIVLLFLGMGVSSVVGIWEPQWPKKSMGFAPLTAILTSSIIWPSFSSTSRTAFTPSALAASATASYGNGHTVMGRTRPTLMPSALS